MRKETFKYIILVICCLFVMIFTFILKEGLYNIKKEDKSLKKNKYIDIGVGIENMYSNRYVDISVEWQKQNKLRKHPNCKKADSSSANKFFYHCAIL